MIIINVFVKFSKNTLLFNKFNHYYISLRIWTFNKSTNLIVIMIHSEDTHKHVKNLSTSSMNGMIQ